MKQVAIIAVLVIALFSHLALDIQASQESNLSSWGRLEWFELQISPNKFRFAVVPDQAIMLAKEYGEKTRGGIWLLQRDDTMANTIINTLDSIIRLNHVIENKENSPEKTFEDDSLKTPSLHIRIGYGTDGYGTKKRWQSYYTLENVPANIETLVQACRSLCDRAINSLSSQDISKEHAQLLITPNVAKVKIAKNGDIYLNKRRVSLKELKQELRQLKESEGIVWYYREKPQKDPKGKVEAVMQDVLKIIIELKLPVKLSEKDFQ